jgi:hypothetical protein
VDGGHRGFPWVWELHVGHVREERKNDFTSSAALWRPVMLHCNPSRGRGGLEESIKTTDDRDKMHGEFECRDDMDGKEPATAPQSRCRSSVDFIPPLIDTCRNFLFCLCFASSIPPVIGIHSCLAVHVEILPAGKACCHCTRRDQWKRTTSMADSIRECSPANKASNMRQEL